MRTKSLAAVLTLALAGAASAADPAVSSLEADLPVWDVAAEDLDGDGVKEILAFGCAEAYPPEKALFVFKAGKNGRYATEPAATLTLKPLVGAGFFAEVDGEAPKEFIAVDAAGAEVFRWKDGAFQSDGVSVFLSLYPNATEEPLFLPAGEDLDGDGVDEWLVPIASGYEVRNADGLKARVYCDVVSEVSSSSNLTITHTLPSVTAFAVPGQESKAVAFLSDEWADFAHGPDWGELTRYRIPVDLQEKWRATTTLEDLNADGLPDLIVTQTRGSVDLEALTHIYMAEGPFEYPDKPTASFSEDKAVSQPFVTDLDGDGASDLLFLKVSFGVGTIINYFVRGKISIDAEAYLYRDGGFPEKPDYDADFSIEAPDGRERNAYAMGDFTGDGVMDAAFGEDADELVFRKGERGEFLSSRTWLKLELPTFGKAASMQLDANERDDLVIFHPAADNSKRVEVVVF